MSSPGTSPGGLLCSWVLCCASLACASCDFFDDVPPGAVLLCAEDAACPDGNVCDLATHVCVPEGVISDVTAPAIVSAVSSLSAVRDGDEVIVTIAADEALAAASLVLAAGVPDPGFLPAVIDEDGATFRVVIGSGTPAGSYVVDAVVLRDAAGNEARRPIDGVVFRVDRTAPRVFALAARSASGEPLSDLAPDVVITLEVDEQIAFAGAAFADLLPGFETCTTDLDVALGFTCALTVTSAVTNGSAAVAVQVRDLAGNVTDAVTSIDVDTAAPSVLPGSVRVTLRDADGDLAPAIVPGGSVELAFDVDEPVALQAGTSSAVAVTLELPGALAPAPLNVVIAANRTSISARLDGANVTLEGQALLTVTLTDAVGHTRTAPLLLSAPFEAGIPVIAVAPSACAHPAPGACPDVDGDGAVGTDDDCVPAAGDDLDCDDADRTSFPGSLEIPDDGRDNDCIGGDLVLDQSDAHVNAVFVDCPPIKFDADATCLDGTIDANDGIGSAASPLRDLLVALDEAEVRGVPVIARGLFDLGIAPITLVALQVPVHGGFLREGDAWVRAPAGAELLAATTMRQRDWVVERGVSDLDFSDADVALLPNTTTIRSFVGVAATHDGARVVDCSGSSVNIIAGASALVAGGLFTNVQGSDFTTLRLHHVDVVNPVIIEGTATLVGVRAPIDVVGDGARVFFSQLRGGPAAEVSFGDFLVVDSTIAGDSVAALSTCTACDDAQTRFSLAGVSLSRESNAVLFREEGVGPDIDDAATFLACIAMPSCEAITASEVVADGAPVGISGVDPFVLGAPPAAVADRNGDCTRLVDGSYVVGFDAP